jgi:cytochrome c553
MNKRYTISIMVSTAAVLAACGGGGGTATSTPATPTSKPSFNLTGTVPGTLIEAFCEDGTYYFTHSEKNGSSKHPFVLKIPTDLSCRLVMTTNEDDPENKIVTPIKFINSNGAGSIAFNGRQDIDLDHIDLALNRAEMLSDNNGDGVEDVPKEVILSGSASSSVQIIISESDPMDRDKNDIIDIYEDDDGDKISNRDDDDDDGDGILDIEDDDHKNDSDGDGLSNDDDKDDDNDGIVDESDPDDDNDGISDENEIEDQSGSGQEDNGQNEENDNNNSNPPAVPVVTSPSAGRLLAAQCAQCHRTDANPDKGFEDLIGEEIFGDLVEMKRENKLELMHLQANGYSDEQIRLIDDYFNNLSAKIGGE